MKKQAKSSSINGNNVKKVKWRKILYDDQGVADNYIDSSFLTEMKKNLYVRHYKLTNVIVEAGTIFQQFSSILLFVIIYSYMQLNWIDPLAVLTLVLLAMIMAEWFCAYHFTKAALVATAHLDKILFFLLLTLSLTPVLKTLTETISTDTIYAMTAGLLLMNWAFHDYSQREPTQMTEDALSVNAGLFAAICLASRFSSLLFTFITIIMAIFAFQIWPQCLRLMRHRFQCQSFQVLLTVLMFSMTVATLYNLSILFTMLYLLMAIVINILLPILLIRMQSLKNIIHGPWDEATIFY